jgi:predicted PurR-regulated permease PerM
MSHPVVVTFLIMAIVRAMSLAAEVLKPLALSVLLAFALTPLAKFLERWGLPRVPAVVMTLLLTLGMLGAVGFVVGEQMTSLATHLPEYRDTIQKKLDQVLNPNQESAFQRARQVADDVVKTLSAPPVERADVSNVRVIQEPTFRDRLQSAVGPTLEFLGVGSFVLVLVLFMMTGREDLRDRILQIFGHNSVSLTTRTMDEIGRRISRYLATFAALNSAYGLVIGLGLWSIGLPLSALWGCLAALTRFFPYVGPAMAFALPMIFSVAQSPGWAQPLEVFVLFAVVETTLNTVLEPVIYGKTTGVSALGLLVAAMFWTWLWGLLGLLLSTPLTVCLAVLGKYVPSLGVFAALLGEESELDPGVRLFQRLLSLDRDSAAEVFDTALKSRPKVEVFDSVLIPALAHAERDMARGRLEDQNLSFVWQVVDEMVDELEGADEMAPASANHEVASDDADSSRPPTLVLGVAANDASDAIVLKMLGQLLAPAGLTLEVVTDAATPMALAERVAEREPEMVVLSHVSPYGLTSVRYQVRRLRARFADLPILVGQWGVMDNASTVSKALIDAGASCVAFSLTEAQDRILAKLGAAIPPLREDVPATDVNTPETTLKRAARLAKVGP